MGKKGSWFSAIKRVFIPNSKEKLANESEKKPSKEKKKKGFGRLRHGDTHSFIPLFREPSSIEKILGDVEREKLFIRPPTPMEQPIIPQTLSHRSPSPRIASPRIKSPRATSPRAASPRVTSPRIKSPRATSPGAASPRVTSPRIASPRVTSPRAASERVISPKAATQRVTSPRAASLRVASSSVASTSVVQPHREIRHRPEPTLKNLHLSATKIQAAYRGYMARRSFRALRGLVRLQGVVRGQNVKRQTMNAMKHMQLLVRVQSQIQSRRIQMLENQALQRQNLYQNDKDLESCLGKLTFGRASEAGNEDWDDSTLTKEEVEARMHRKVEAVIKRERALAYAYSHQLWKATPRSAQSTLMDLRSGGFPWWWNWLERQVLPVNPPENQSMKNARLTPPRSVIGQKASPLPQSSNYRQQNYGFDDLESVTPRSTKSSAPMRNKQSYTPSSRNPRASSSFLSKHSKPGTSAAASPFALPLKDDDSMTSCPPFSVPNYLTPTISAKAKVRANSNPKDRFPSTPGSEPKRRLSFPLAQNMGSFKWNNGSLFSGKDSSSQRVLGKNQPLQSLGDLSVDSTVSLPAGVGRKPFNRFV
ncbi:IQ motif, EF-hand binding site [Dillenia turbinata]|uniref:IQ motif, EF-hand binding site n=1 Tax=Dillenia turbinata TaxID=194707 RepID=A0AAN8YVN5_9MAGN